MESLATYEGLVKRYRHGLAVDDLTFEVPEGQVCGLLGPNGAGKTTAIRVLLGLARPTKGSTTLLGARTGQAGFGEAIRHVGTLIEGPALYSRATARQNMRIEAEALGMRDPDTAIAELLERVGLSARADTKAGSFSLGMRQRLGLAASLLGNPKLVVLDEPTNGLDPAGIVEIRELIKELPKHGTTVLVSSHLLAEVQLMCDRVTIINRGKLVAEGTIAELLAGEGGGGTSFTVALPVEQVEAAQAVMSQAGFGVTPLGEGRVTVTGSIEDGVQISRPLAEAGIFVAELRRESIDLEQVFLRLTDGESSDRDSVAKPAAKGVVS